MKDNKKSYGTQNDQNLKLLIALTRTNQAVHRRSAELFSKEGLTNSQFSVLEALYHKGSMTINQLIQTVLSTGGNMTVVIHNLEKDKLVSRCTNPEDKRSSLISITDEGKKKVEEVFPVHLRDLEKCFASLSSEQKNGLISLLKKLGTNT